MECEMKNRICVLAGVLFVAGLSAVYGTQVAVDFGGKYSDRSINSSKRVSHVTGDFDFDGAVNDRAAVVEFGSLFSPPKHGSWNELDDKSNGTVYQGLSIAVLGGNVDLEDVMSRFSGDRIQLGAKCPGQMLRLAAAIYWEAGDFLCKGKEAVSAPLANEPKSLQASVKNNGVKPVARFLIQAGGKWYVSSDCCYGNSFKVNGATALWHEFDPVANQLFLDEKNLGPSVAGSTLGNVTAAGLYAQTETYSGDAGSFFGLETLEVKLAD
jgi:hypothetical protein